jgi:hypothetical protein
MVVFVPTPAAAGQHRTWAKAAARIGAIGNL